MSVRYKQDCYTLIAMESGKLIDFHRSGIVQTTVLINVVTQLDSEMRKKTTIYHHFLR